VNDISLASSDEGLVACAQLPLPHKGTAVPLQALKAHKGRSGIASLVL
jgi:hypothetical protein